ncbi:hypothetical protein D3C84_1053820 [compost metagenome]
MRPGRNRTRHTVAAGVQSLLALANGHRRTLGEIRRARPDIQVPYTGQVQRRCDGTQVHHFQRRAQLPRQDADGRAAADEVEQHLPGDFLGIGRYAFGDHTMVTGKNRDP